MTSQLKTDPACVSTQVKPKAKQWEYLLSDYNHHNKITATELAERHEIRMINDSTISIRGIEVELMGHWDERNELKGPFYFSFKQDDDGYAMLFIHNTDANIGRDCATLPLLSVLPLPANNAEPKEPAKTIMYRGRLYQVQDDGNFNPVLVPVA